MATIEIPLNEHRKRMLRLLESLQPAEDRLVDSYLYNAKARLARLIVPSGKPSG